MNRGAEGHVLDTNDETFACVPGRVNQFYAQRARHGISREWHCSEVELRAEKNTDNRNHEAGAEG